MSREIKFSLVYRDMWQSSGKYTARIDQLEEIAPVIVEMGCFDRVETNGGAFEQVQLLYGQNPNKAVRAWTEPLRKAGIQTHMLERALNGLRMNPVPEDVRYLMFKVKKAQGVDIARSFCGLNDHRNLKASVLGAKEAGMISQAALSITYSPVHTVEYYMDVVDHLVEYGCDEICLKDMAGVGRPVTLGRLVKSIKDKYPHIKVQYHGHTGPGFAMASMLEVAKAGADYVDAAIEPLSWGKIHPDVISLQAMFKDAGFLVKDINMEAYMEARALTQKFIDEFLGYFIEPTNKHCSSLLVGCGLPGGMMGSMMADLKGFMGAINMSQRNQGKPELTLDQMCVKLFQEVEYVWPRLGYPPLVTPFSQYVKNTALMNLMHTLKGEPRWSTIDPDTMNMIIGKTGKLPGPLAPEIVDIVKAKGLEFYTGNPQDAFPNELPKFIKMMEEEGWDRGQDDEELFELAMHERQYRDYKSGIAEKRFNDALEEAKAKAGAPKIVTRPVVEVPAFDVEKVLEQHPAAKPIQSPAAGQLIWNVDPAQESVAPNIGSPVTEGKPVCYVQAYYGIEQVKALASGRIVSVNAKHGDKVEKGQILGFIE
ncbi:MAG: biotin/lipoyl-binding protein [Bacteroidales bacterium]|nr:biotin/lipoyl-binding protein [Bacteroidales bacterium]